MPVAAKRRRGATAIRSDATPMPQLKLPRFVKPRRRTLAGIACLACIATGLILLPPDKDDLTSREQLEDEPRPVAELAQPAIVPDIFADETADSAPEEVLPKEQPWLDQVVKRGDNLSLVFRRAGFGERDVHRVLTEAPDGKSLARIYPGQVIAFQADNNGELTRIRHIRSPLETAVYWKTDRGFTSEIETRSPQVRESWATGEITSSLFLAGQRAGLSQKIFMDMANIFGGVIDFVLDPRKGDTIQVIYEELYLDGEKYRDGDIVAASFTNQGKTHNAFRYKDANGDVNYYNEDGVSMRKAFLLAPLDFTRISSNFNLKRLHPIYKTTRPHRGTDYAASRGTPVYAAGDGRVIKAGYSRANGNYVFIQHGEQYVTRYLHLHKRKVKQGQRVAQSQVIGTVGSTGAATGPHLHYEFLMNGIHRDPRTIHQKLPKAKSLPKAEMSAFRQAISEASSQLAALRTNNHLAMSEPERQPSPGGNSAD